MVFQPKIGQFPTVVVNKNVTGMYAQPDRSSEMISQAVLGSSATILEERPDWRRVRTPDDYIGWIESRWLVNDKPGSSYAASGIVARVSNLFSDLRALPQPGSEILTKAVIGTELEVAETQDDWVVVRLPDGGQCYIRRFAVKLLNRAVYPLPLFPTGGEIAATARRFVGVPYLWGGTTPFGLDCSGFVQLAHKLHGVPLSRDAYLQAEDARFTPVDADSMLAGDLLFFGSSSDTPSGREITHVGIALGGGRFIHSSGGAGVCKNLI